MKFFQWIEIQACTVYPQIFCNILSRKDKYDIARIAHNILKINHTMFFRWENKQRLF